MKPVIATQSTDLASPVDAVWPLVTETDRVNRWLGLPSIRLRPVDPESRSAARFVVDTKSGGIPTSYEEHPFEWTNEREFRSFRRMIGGPFVSILTVIKFEALGTDGTRITVTIEVLPRTVLVKPIAWLVTRQVLGNLCRLYTEIDKLVHDRGPNPYRQPASPPHVHELALAIERLKEAGTDKVIADILGKHVGTAADADCVRMRPFDLADDWGQNREDVLKAFLHGVPAGIVELRWGVICPSCRTASEQFKALDEISDLGHCQLCDITFELELDKCVEATFVPHKSVREVPDQMFCIGGPARTPHVLVQTNISAHEARELPAPAEEGRYRIFARGGAAASLEIAKGAPEQVAVTIDGKKASPAELKIGPLGTVTVTNDTDEDRHVKLERLGYASTAATAHIVSTMQDFRRLFSSELIKRDTPLKVARVAILFSDLTGSTALYSTIGDAAAFRLVDDHFDVLRKAIGLHGGVVVKTMGDAILAAFPDAQHCAQAAIEVLKAFEQFRVKSEHGALVGLKLGMHAGACYVVNANGVLDYFGQTVNIASRVQHLAQAGELIMAEETFGDLVSSDLERMRVVERFDAKIKGVDRPMKLLRLLLTDSMVPGTK